jgi:hypothetical protein
MVNGVIIQKLQTLDQTLTELRSLGQVDVTILVDAVNHRLTDFDQFRAEVLAYVQR